MVVHNMVTNSIESVSIVTVYVPLALLVVVINVLLVMLDLFYMIVMEIIKELVFQNVLMDFIKEVQL